MAHTKDRKRATGPGKIAQERFSDLANADKQMTGILVEGEVVDTVSNDPAASPVLVGDNNLIRVRFSTAGPHYIHFGDDSSTLTTPATSSSSPAIEVQDGYWLIATTGAFVSMSATPDRLEIIEQ